MKKFRYEYPPMEAHFLEAPSAEAVVKYIKVTYPHNFVDVLPTMVEIPRWPVLWKTLDFEGRVLPKKRNS